MKYLTAKILVLKKIYLIYFSIACCFFLLLWNPISAQNLLSNPGFEEHDGCPVEKDHYPLKYVKDWKAPQWVDSNGYKFIHSPDFFHSCAEGKFGNPDNFLGHQAAFKGKGYSGLYVYKVQTREYLQIKLNKPLKDSQYYYIKAHVSLCDRCLLGINKIGALFTKKRQFLGYNKDYTPLQPMEGDPNQILDQKDKWVPVSGCFLAKGGEKFVTIGNFLKDTQTPSSWVKNTSDKQGLRRAYYYIDEISVMPCKELEDCPCKHLAKNKLKEELKGILKNKDVTSRLQLVDIYFKTDKASLVNSSYRVIDQLAKFLKKHEDFHVLIEGHTDDRGSAEYNMKLSRERAKTVYDYLLKKGIRESRLDYKGHGATQPIASNETPRGRRLNRRVEFTLEYQEKK